MALLVHVPIICAEKLSHRAKAGDHERTTSTSLSLERDTGCRDVKVHSGYLPVKKITPVPLWIDSRNPVSHHDVDTKGGAGVHHVHRSVFQLCGRSLSKLPSIDPTTTSKTTVAMGCESSVEVLSMQLIPQVQRVAVVSPSFCKPRMVTLQAKHRFLSSTIMIRDVNLGVDVFGIKRHSFSSRQTLVRVDKTPIVNYKTKTSLFASKPIYYVYPGETQNMVLFEIYAKYSRRDRAEVRVEFTDAFTGQYYLFGLVGDWYHRNAFIWLDRGLTGVREPVARVHCPPGVARAEYHLDVAPNVDIALMFMICNILDTQERQAESD